MPEYQMLLKSGKVVTVNCENVFEAFNKAEKEHGEPAIECEEDWV